MEVILLKNTKNLGKAGDLIDVEPGFANNYLFPKGMAKLATPGNKKQVVDMLKQLAKRDAGLKVEAALISEKLAKITLELQVQASDVGKIFGSVTPAHIKEVLETHQIDITPKQIRLIAPIKEIGLHKVEIMLHPEVAPVVECNVVAF